MSRSITLSPFVSLLKNTFNFRAIFCAGFLGLSVLILTVVSAFSAFAASVEADEETMKMEEIVVTATRVEESVEDVAQDVTIVTAKEIEKRSYDSIADVLKGVMGVKIKEYGNRGASATPSIRASTAEQVLILIDGKRLNLPSSGQFDLNDIPVPLENIERIEVLRGDSSALYGADAMGGVINIITKKPFRPVTRAKVQYGRFDTKSFLFYTSRKLNRFGYSFAAQREDSHGFRADTDYKLWNLNSKFTLDLADDVDVVLSIDYGHKEAGSPGSTEWPTPGARQWNENALYGLTFNAKNTHLRIYSHYSRLHYNKPDPFFPEDSTHKNYVRGVDGQTSFALGEMNLITVGAEILEEKVISTNIGNKHRSRIGAFLQDELSVTDDFIVTAGVRYDDYENGNRVSPKLSLLLRPFSGTTLRASAGKGYRVPTLNELYWPDMGWAVGNPHLKPEKSTGYEVSVEQKFGKNVRAKVLGFYKKIRDLIEWEEVSPWRWMPVNIGKARIKGIEVETSVDLGKVDLLVSYTYQDPEDIEKDQKITDRQRHDLNANITYISENGLSVSLEGSYVSNYVSTTGSHKSYFVMNAKVSQEFTIGRDIKGTVYVKGKNIFDREYEVAKGYPMPGQQLIAGVAVEF